MSKFSPGLLSLLALVPFGAGADVTVGDLPADTVWYLHADLDGMRKGAAGSKVYDWFRAEVTVDINDEIGIDIDKEVDSVTAFANSANGTVIIIDGAMSKDSQDKMLALAAQQGPVDPREFKGKTYYFFGHADGEDYDPDDEPLDDIKDSSYVSFALKGKAIVTGNEGQMQELLANNGKVTGAGSHTGALLVLSANKTLVQAGMQTEGLADDGDDDWDSNIVRNTKQAALMMAEDAGMLALEAQLVSTDPKMAEALGGIVNGLIGLQAFNSELGPEIQSLIRNTRVKVNDNILSISMVIDPQVVVDVLED